MSIAAAVLALAMLVGFAARRPHGWGPALGALLALAIALAGGAAQPGDLVRAAGAQWRPYLVLLAILAMTASADQLGLLDRLAALIEPRTRGPVRRAFTVTFALSAGVATILSNDAAILLLTPAVLTLLRTVYPVRNPKFVVPFAFAVFCAAGVAPLVISNPMNLVFADHVGLDFNHYSRVMVPVALASWLSTYAVLRWLFRDVLADDAPALGAWPGRATPLSGGARLVVAVLGVSMAAYPIAALVEAPLWPVAIAAAVVCVLASVRSGVKPAALARAVPWGLFPFLLCVFVLALGLERVGAVDQLARLYASAASMPTVGAVSALGSAVLNNHPMSVLNALALDRVAAGDGHAFAALIGGDLGPRLLPMGSLAGLLWFDTLRRHGVAVRVGAFVRLGVAVTIPPMIVSMLVLWALVR